MFLHSQQKECEHPAKNNCESAQEGLFVGVPQNGLVRFMCWLGSPNPFQGWTKQHPPNCKTGRRCVLHYKTNQQLMNILKDIAIGGDLVENDDIFSE